MKTLRFEELRRRVFALDDEVVTLENAVMD
jgi:hypothetical protein